MSNFPAGAEHDSSAPYNTKEVEKEYIELYLKEIQDENKLRDSEYLSVVGEDYNFTVTTVWGGYSIHVDEYDDTTINDFLENKRDFYHNVMQSDFIAELNKITDKIRY